MSRARILVAVACALALLVLAGWNAQRQRLVARCLEAGGQWVGPQSRCDPDPRRITIQRELRRT
jgi:hypothetical protein